MVTTLPPVPSHLKSLLRAIELTAMVHSDQPYRPMEPPEETPYLSHLLAVAAIVLQHGGTPDQATAAVSHDIKEDQSHWFGGREGTSIMLEDEFSPHVSDIVEAVTDPEGIHPDEGKKIIHTRTAVKMDPSSWKVKAADWLNTLQAVTASVIAYGPDKAFNGFLATDPTKKVDDQIRTLKNNGQQLWTALNEAHKRFIRENAESDLVSVRYRIAILDAIDSEMKRLHKWLRRAKYPNRKKHFNGVYA